MDMEMKEKQLLLSCVPNENVQNLFLDAVKEDDLEEIEYLFKTEEIDVNYIYDDTLDIIYENKNALQIACHYFATDDKAKTSEKSIKLLLNLGANIFYTDPDSQKNALNFAAESGNEEILNVILKYIKKNDLNIYNSDVIYNLVRYIKDNDQNEENFIAILKLLLDADIDINYQDVHSGWTVIYMACKYKYKQFVQTIIDMKISEINLDEFIDRHKKSARKLITENDLYNGILPEVREENSNVTVFTLYKNIRNKSIEDFEKNYRNLKQNLSDIEKYKLLKMAVKCHAEKTISLITNDIDLNKFYSSEDHHPMVLAAQKGYFKILKIFLSTKPNSELISQALFELLKVPYTNSQTENINYNKCLTLLLKSENLDIHATDFNGNTALHYSVRYQPEMAIKILRKGASLASKDSFNRLAIADIDSVTLETHLNECIRYENEEISTRDDACLVLNFSSLLLSENHTIPENLQIPVETDSETDVINNKLLAETEVLEYMAGSRELKQLLKHPLILTFLFLKWHRIAKFFYINLSLYILFVASLLGYITFGYNIKTSHPFITGLSYVILFSTLMLLIIREIFQLILYKFRYFLAFENWLEIVLLVSVGGILTENSNLTLMRQFSAVAIVAAAIEFLLLVGQFPSMSTNIMMLRTVSFTFFKLFLWYSILLFAFSYSFYTLFQEGDEVKPSNSTITDEDEEQDFFEDPGMSLLKTIVMLTGEFDAGSIKFDSFPVISHLIFVMFVFLIAIVLFNLLNGLAVSDTQIIKNDAELYEQILRVEHISHVERTLLKNRIIRWVPAVRKICLFNTIRKFVRAEVYVYPNENSKVILMETKKINESKAHCFKIFFGVYLNKKIQRSISSLLKERKEEHIRKKKEDQLLEEIGSLRKLLTSFIEKQS